MPKSRKRGGKGKKSNKTHQKRVENRNKQISDQKNRYEKYQKEQFDKLLAEYEKQQKEKEKLSNDVPGVDQISGVDGPEI